ILMGRKTADSLGRALPGRTNLVMTRSGRVPFDGMQTVASVEQALEMTRASGVEELCVIGGAEIYALTLPLADRLHVTHLDTLVDGADAFFPPFDADEWSVITRESHLVDAKHAFAFEFVDYQRRRGPAKSGR
ncbi:MAG: dihydrofolate reductase, partial [Pseudoxanthomonas sp.]